jgi:F-type H+-transporting ATPase subunit b
MTRSIVIIVALAVLLCGTAWAQEASDAGATDQGLFSGAMSDAAWTILAFLLLVAVLGKWAWKPLLAALEARQNHIDQQIKSAQASRVEAERLLEDYKEQGLTVVRQAVEQAQRYQQDAAEKTRQETAEIRRRSQEEIESAKASATEVLWRQTGDIVLHVGSAVLGRALTEQDNQRLIDEAVAKIRQEGAAP